MSISLSELTDILNPGFSPKPTRKQSDLSFFDLALREETQVSKNGTGHLVYLPDEDTLYSGGNGTGLSFTLKYADTSTPQDPTVIAKGVDEKGKEFTQTIHITQVNPRNATLVEMRALESHLGLHKLDGLSSLPLGSENVGLHDRQDFLTLFQRAIRDSVLLGQRETSAYWQYALGEYGAFLGQPLQEEDLDALLVNQRFGLF